MKKGKKKKSWIRYIYNGKWACLRMLIFSGSNMYPLETKMPKDKDYKKVRITIEEIK